MADQPQRPIEKLLRTWGKQRVPTDSLQMHAATRRLLQSQVADVYSRKQRKINWLNYLTVPRLAWGLGVVLTGGLGIWFATSSLKQNQPQDLLAQKDKAAQPAIESGAPNPTIAMRETSNRQAPPSEEAKGTVALQQEAAIGSAQLEQQKQSPTLALNSAGNPSTDGASALNVGAVANAPKLELANTDKNVSRYGLASPSAAPAAKQSDMLAKVQSFVQTSSNVLASKAGQQATGVLASFQFVQSGSEVRIIDQDGSVYVGALKPAFAATQAQARSRQQLVTLETADARQSVPRAPSTASQEFLFNVAGTNRTLQKKLVFNGRWYSSGYAPATQAFTNTTASRQILGTQVVPASAAAINGPRVSGTAVIGGTQNLEVNATAAEP